MGMNVRFRGNRIDNGEWVEGSLVTLDYHNSVDYVEETQIVANNGHAFVVDPDSVGMFTGLTDKTGKEIFGAIGEKGGDIVANKTHSFSRDCQYVVKYRNGGFYGWSNEGDDFGPYTLNLYINDQHPKLEIIGNQFEETRK